jgi:hypothetical protein
MQKPVSERTGFDNVSDLFCAGVHLRRIHLPALVAAVCFFMRRKNVIAGNTKNGIIKQTPYDGNS